jgi:hypothetical protein
VFVPRDRVDLNVQPKCLSCRDFWHEPKDENH